MQPATSKVLFYYLTKMQNCTKSSESFGPFLSKLDWSAMAIIFKRYIKCRSVYNRNIYQKPK